MSFVRIQYFCAFVGLGSGYCEGSLQVSVSVVFVVSVKSTSANPLVIMNKFFGLGLSITNVCSQTATVMTDIRLISFCSSVFFFFFFYLNP